MLTKFSYAPQTPSWLGFSSPWPLTTVVNHPKKLNASYYFPTGGVINIVMSMSVCPLALTWKPHGMLPVAVARSSSHSVAIRYVLPVLWMMSCFHIMALDAFGCHRFGAFVASTSWPPPLGMSRFAIDALQFHDLPSQNSGYEPEWNGMDGWIELVFSTEIATLSYMIKLNSVISKNKVFPPGRH